MRHIHCHWLRSSHAAPFIEHAMCYFQHMQSQFSRKPFRFGNAFAQLCDWRRTHPRILDVFLFLQRNFCDANAPLYVWVSSELRWLFIQYIFIFKHWSLSLIIDVRQQTNELFYVFRCEHWKWHMAIGWTYILLNHSVHTMDSLPCRANCVTLWNRSVVNCHRRDVSSLTPSHVLESINRLESSSQHPSHTNTQKSTTKWNRCDIICLPSSHFQTLDELLDFPDLNIAICGCLFVRHCNELVLIELLRGEMAN